MPKPSSPHFTAVCKRNGLEVPYNQSKVTQAIKKALSATNESASANASQITATVESILTNDDTKLVEVPSVEQIQDAVEHALIQHKLPATAKAYILYRAKRSEARRTHDLVPEHVRSLTAESKTYFADNPLGEFVYLRTYARWKPEEKRRETWIETVDRYLAFMKENLGDKLTETEYEEVRAAILKQEVMPSMRLLQFAGDPARRCNTCAYNCTFIAPATLTDFAEIMYLSMQGCGVGFSVESYNIEKLPQIARDSGEVRTTYTIEDSKEGWCDALTAGLTAWYEGADISFNYDLIRPAGARLKTMGGKASGPEPLRALLEFARSKIKKQAGRRLRPIDVHDIICKIGECVVAGGVRRTAMISLSDLDDAELREAKHGQFYLTEPQRSVANNSAVYERTPSSHELMEEWVALMQSGSGERGIFNRGSLAETMPARRRAYFKKLGLIDANGVVCGPIGTNPCGEIILQSKQFCNLSEVIARKGDSKETLLRKTRIAAILGTYQSSLTKFNYISPDWQKHCEAECLLGVSITGQWDCETARKADVLTAMRDVADATNATYAKRFGINRSMSVTAVKPSGTVSQTFNCSSGIHPRHAQYYIRRIRISATDSLFKMLKDQGVPYHPEIGQTEANASTYVLEFPVAAPANTKSKDDLSALEQLEYWKRIKLHYTQHNPSATISVGDDEWIAVVAWLQENWKIVGGLSFLPRFDHVYQLAPYEAISKDEYERRKAAFPEIDYTKLLTYEHQDETEQKQEVACAGGTCDIDMVVGETTVHQ